MPRDRAFCFYYEDNLDLLRQQGVEIVEFSPMADRALPPDLDALYLGGGYPELYAGALSANPSMLASVREFAASDRPIYAECGGMIYLSQQIETSDGQIHAMAGVLPFGMEMTRGLVQFGYVAVELTRDCLLGACGTIVRGHSFHYSRVAGRGPDRETDVPAGVVTSYRVQYSLSGRQENEGYGLRNVLASYVHLHFRAAPGLARQLVETARRIRQRELAST